jgi:hypothetical protein
VEWSTIVLVIVLIGVTTSALFVFVSAARLYVSDTDDTDQRAQAARHPERRAAGVAGRDGDRRKRGGDVTFPLRLHDLVIQSERRRMPDRRQGTIH